MVECIFTTLKYFARLGLSAKAFRTLSLIQSHALASASGDLFVDSISTLLLSCTQFKHLPEGKQLHTQIITRGLQGNPSLVPKLVSFYIAFGFLDDAHFVTVNSNTHHPLPWNLLISSYVSIGLFVDAIFAYKQMGNKRIRPDDFTYPYVMKACGERLNLLFGREVHKSIKGTPLEWNLFVQNALVSMYGKCGDVDTARGIFDKMRVKDQVSWNSIISICASNGRWAEAFELFESSQSTGLEFNIIPWNTIDGGCLKTGNFKGNLELLCEMRMRGHCLDPVAVIIGLGACSHISSLKLGKEIHGLAIRNLFIDYD